MMKTQNKLYETFYSKDGRKHVNVMETPEKIYIDFFQDDVLIGGSELIEHSIHYAHSMAENYCSGILTIFPWRSDESIKSYFLKYTDK